MYCDERHPDGWFCLRPDAHDGPHLSLDNTRLWRGSPGYPLWWDGEPRAPLDPDTVREALDPTGTASPDPSGLRCGCGTLLIIVSGTLALCVSCDQSVDITRRAS